jgi:hypothetical protein
MFRPSRIKFHEANVHGNFENHTLPGLGGGEGRKLIFNFTVHIFFPIWVKFDIRDLNLILPGISEFHKNRRREAVPASLA